MKKLNIGCGANILSGWENYDLYPFNGHVKFIDITNPLPFEDDSVDFIHSEHVQEHISTQEGYNFFKEAKRILKKNGVIRTLTPSLVQIANGETEEYRNFIRAHGWGDGQPGCGVRAILFEHGHQCLYTEESLTAILNSLGFKAEKADIYTSAFEELNNISGHSAAISDAFNKLETFCVEAIK